MRTQAQLLEEFLNRVPTAAHQQLAKLIIVYLHKLPAREAHLHCSDRGPDWCFEFIRANKQHALKVFRPYRKPPSLKLVH